MILEHKNSTVITYIANHDFLIGDISFHAHDTINAYYKINTPFGGDSAISTSLSTLKLFIISAVFNCGKFDASLNSAKIMPCLP